MAEPFDSAGYLEDVSDIVQTQYFKNYEVNYHDRFGRVLNKMFSPSAEVITGDGKTMQTELAPADTVRANSDPLGEFAAPDILEAEAVRVRFNRQTAPTGHDFTEFSASCQFDDLTIENASKGTIVDVADRVYKQVQGQFDEHLAVLRHAPRSARIALVNGTPRLNDHWTFASATSTATNAGGARLQVDNGSIAALRRGARIDFVNASGTVVAGNVRVTDVNPADLSIGVAFTSSGSGVLAGRVSTGNLASVADNHTIVYSGEYNKGLYSLGAWFGRPTAGESFIGGVDRTTAGFRWMLPISTREGSSNTPLTKSHFNDLAIAMGFLIEDGQDGMVFVTDPTLNQKLRDEIGEEAFFQIPEGSSDAKRVMKFGSLGLNYQHPQFGLTKILVDPLMPAGTVRVLDPSTWKTLPYLWQGLKPMKENGAHWYRMPSATPGNGKSKIWKADWYCNMTDWCTRPWRNGQIMAVTS